MDGERKCVNIITLRWMRTIIMAINAFFIKCAGQKVLVIIKSEVVMMMIHGTNNK